MNPGPENSTYVQDNGSILLASASHEADQLQQRADMLQQNGIRAAYHSSADLKELEPALQLPDDGGGLLVESDSQLVRRCCPLLCAAFAALHQLAMDSAAVFSYALF